MFWHRTQMCCITRSDLELKQFINCHSTTILTIDQFQFSFSHFQVLWVTVNLNPISICKNKIKLYTKKEEKLNGSKKIFYFHFTFYFCFFKRFFFSNIFCIYIVTFLYFILLLIYYSYVYILALIPEVLLHSWYFNFILNIACLEVCP